MPGASRYRAVPDARPPAPRKRLPDACRAYGLAGWEQVDKDAISKDIGEGRWEKYGKDAVMAYCEEDVRMEVRLLHAQLRGHFHLRDADVARVIFWSEYSAKCVTIASQGMYIDMPLWDATQENKAAVITELLPQLDPSHAPSALSLIKMVAMNRSGLRIGWRRTA